MVSRTEMKWRIRILQLDGKLDDMFFFCDMTDDSKHDCKKSSFVCGATTHPTIDTCKKCLCVICNRSDYRCHLYRDQWKRAEVKRKW